MHSSAFSIRFHYLRFQVNTECAFQSAITCSKLTLETLEQGAKYVQN